MKEILITSTVLIAVILLLRLLLRKRVSRRLIYATWLLVALRLLIPVQFGQFQYSVTAVAETLEQRSPLIQQVQEDLQQSISGPDKEAYYQQLLQNYLAQTEVPDTPTVSPEVETQLRQEAQVSPITPLRLLTVLWVCGIILTAGWFLATNLIFLHKIRKDAIPFSNCNSPVPVLVSPQVCTPCLVGLFRPRIYLTPKSTTDSQTLNHVLTHELTHLKHWDHIWAWVRCLCLCIYWFHPLVWLAAILSKRDCELACDEAALKKLGECQRIAYGRTLLATVTHASVRIFHTTTAMSESRNQLKERVNFIVKKPKNLLIAAVCLVLVTVLTAGLVFTGCKPKEDPLPPSTIHDDPTTKPTTKPPVIQTEPPIPPTAPSVIPAVPPAIDTGGPTLEQLMIKDAIDRYLWYKVRGACCDVEYVQADMSQYLTDAQKEHYYSSQYKITCCRNAQQVRQHIDRCLSKGCQELGYPDSKLFTDGKGNLYVTVLPTEYDAYRHYEVISQSEEQIMARACSYDEDGCFRNEIFTLSATENGYQVTGIEEDRDYRCEPVTIAQGPNYKVLQYGSSYGYELYDSHGNLKVDYGVDFCCPIVTPISEDIMEVAVYYEPGLARRIYWDMETLNQSDPYDSVIGISTEKIAYLEGEPEHQYLVVCDIFDRSTAQAFTDISCDSDTAPISGALFSENDTRVTISYQNIETTVTLSLDP